MLSIGPARNTASTLSSATTPAMMTASGALLEPFELEPSELELEPFAVVGAGEVVVVVFVGFGSGVGVGFGGGGIVRLGHGDSPVVLRRTYTGARGSLKCMSSRRPRSAP